MPPPHPTRSGPARTRSPRTPPGPTRDHRPTGNSDRWASGAAASGLALGRGRLPRAPPARRGRQPAGRWGPRPVLGPRPRAPAPPRPPPGARAAPPGGCAQAPPAPRPAPPAGVTGAPRRRARRAGGPGRTRRGAGAARPGARRAPLGTPARRTWREEEVGCVLVQMLGGDSVCTRSALSAECSPVPAQPEVSTPTPGLCPGSESSGRKGAGLLLITRKSVFLTPLLFPRNSVFLTVLESSPPCGSQKPLPGAQVHRRTSLWDSFGKLLAKTKPPSGKDGQALAFLCRCALGVAQS
nr:translation initiation factor IF-2-like [Ovis aries]